MSPSVVDAASWLVAAGGVGALAFVLTRRPLSKTAPRLRNLMVSITLLLVVANALTGMIGKIPLTLGIMSMNVAWVLAVYKLGR
jgi:hypothetical protein